MRTSSVFCAGLLATTAQSYGWMGKLNGRDITQIKKPLEERANSGTCPVHAAVQGAAPYSTYYPSKYTGAKNGLPGTGKGGVLVPAAGDTAHAYKAPSSSDIRGPCPALNMAANHNFLSHDGLTTYTELVDMAQNVFNWGWDLATFVASFGVTMDGNPLTGQLSIGCSGGQPVPNTGLNSHDKFEGDVSMARTDFYLSPTGNAYDVNGTLFSYMANYCNGVLTLQCMGRYMGSRYNQSLTTNGNFFASPLLLFNFGTATLPQESFASLGNQGTPSIDTMASFWGVTKDSGAPNYKYTAHPGTERLPSKWYNRPTALSFPEILAETLSLYAEAGFPSFGGNTGAPNTFVGLNFPAGGIQNGKLQNPTVDGIACLFQQVLTDVVPTSLENVLTLSPAAALFARTKLGTIFSQFGCPAL